MPVVRNKVTNPAGHPLRGEDVVIRLMASTDGAAPGFDPAGDAVIRETWRTKTDQAGEWTATLIANSLLTPVNTYYEVSEGRKSDPLLIVVPNGAGPYWAGDILTDPPAGLRNSASDELTAADGALELSLASGLTGVEFGKAFLGTLGEDLYCFGSIAETTGALAGISRWRPGTGWTFLGIPASNPQADFNGHAQWGASEFGGKLYIGDRRAGKLRRLDLNADGTLIDLVDVATMGGEDVFPGPVWMNRLWCGTFGVGAPTNKNPEVWTFDGTTATRVLDLTTLGVNGQVLSIVAHDEFLWVSAINAGATVSQIWRIDRSFVPVLVNSGTELRYLAANGSDLMGLRVSHPDSNDHSFWDVWTGSGWAAASPEIVVGGPVTTMGGVGLGGSLLSFHYNNGVYEFTDGQTRQLVLGPNDGPRPSNVRVHGGYLWVVGNQPPNVWRKRLGQGRPLRALGHPHRRRGSAVFRRYECIMRRTGEQQVPNSTFTAIPWNSVESNPDAMWSAGDPTKIVIPEAGRYRITANVEWASAVGRTITDILLNSNTGAPIARAEATQTAGILAVSLSREIRLAKGDHITVSCFQLTGGTVLLGVGLPYHHVSVTWQAP